MLATTLSRVMMERDNVVVERDQAIATCRAATDAANDLAAGFSQGISFAQPFNILVPPPTQPPPPT
jgi:hypothetical protein